MVTTDESDGRAEAVDDGPDWNRWGQRDSGALLDLVALSCDLDPEMLRDGGLSTAHHPEFFDRWDVARRQLDQGQIPMAPDALAPPGPHTSVRLVDFATWAIGLGWSLPPGFPRPT